MKPIDSYYVVKISGKNKMFDTTESSYQFKYFEKAFDYMETCVKNCKVDNMVVDRNGVLKNYLNTDLRKLKSYGKPAVYFTANNIVSFLYIEKKLLY